VNTFARMKSGVENFCRLRTGDRIIVRRAAK
jgi:hypothetical protein